MEEIQKYETGAVTVQNENEHDFRIRLQNFQMRLNKEPDPAEVKKNKASDNSDYIPISNVQMTADELFFGLYNTKNFRTKVIGNEVVGDIEVEVFHPVAKVWITRTGSAAVPIRFKKDSDITDVGNKIKTALVMDYPHLEAQCEKAGFKKFGRIFGRDLNREFTDTYNPLIKPIEEPINNEALRDFLADYIDPLTKDELKAEAVRIIDVAKKTLNPSEINELKNIIKERVK